MSSLTRRLLSVVFGAAVLAAGAAEAGSIDGRPGHLVTPSGFSMPVYGTHLMRGADGRLTTSCARLTDAQIDSLYARSETARATMASETTTTVRAHGVTFTIIYSDPDGTGFKDPEIGQVRREALEAAVTKWSDALGGAIPVAIDVRMESMPESPSTLASAAPTDFAVRDGEAVPLALAAQILNMVVNDGRSDIQVRFNADHQWSYDPNGDASTEAVNFGFVALHELGHGLGFLDTYAAETGTLLLGMPTPFDKLMNRGTTDGNRLVNRSAEDVMADFRSDDLYFAGPNGIQAALVATIPLPMPKLYSPAEIESGSTGSHLDQTTYPDLLMRPGTGGGADANLVDPLTTAIMLDLGWTAAAAPVVASPGR